MKLEELSEYPEAILQYELEYFVDGEGVSNIQMSQLTNRTRYLYDRLQETETYFESIIPELGVIRVLEPADTTINLIGDVVGISDELTGNSDVYIQTRIEETLNVSNIKAGMMPTLPTNSKYGPVHFFGEMFHSAVRLKCNSYLQYDNTKKYDNKYLFGGNVFTTGCGLLTPPNPRYKYDHTIQYDNSEQFGYRYIGECQDYGTLHNGASLLGEDQYYTQCSQRTSVVFANGDMCGGGLKEIYPDEISIIYDGSIMASGRFMYGGTNYKLRYEYSKRYALNYATDTGFKCGPNGVVSYGGSCEVAVVLVDEPELGNLQPYNTTKRLKITHVNETSGFYQRVDFKSDRRYALKFDARVPVGYELVLDVNAIPDSNHSTHNWMSNHIGTGKIETYVVTVSTGRYVDTYLNYNKFGVKICGKTPLLGEIAIYEISTYDLDNGNSYTQIASRLGYHPLDISNGVVTGGLAVPDVLDSSDPMTLSNLKYLRKKLSQLPPDNYTFQLNAIKHRMDISDRRMELLFEEVDEMQQKLFKMTEDNPWLYPITTSSSTSTTTTSSTTTRRPTTTRITTTPRPTLPPPPPLPTTTWTTTTRRPTTTTTLPPTTTTLPPNQPIHLENNDVYRVSRNSMLIFGSSGTNTVSIPDNIVGTNIDSNVENIMLDSGADMYRYVQTTNMVMIYTKTSSVAMVSFVPTTGGTTLKFGDGTSSVAIYDIAEYAFTIDGYIIPSTLL